MNKHNKIIILLLIVVVACLVLSGCGQEKTSDNDTSNSTGQLSQPNQPDPPNAPNAPNAPNDMPTKNSILLLACKIILIVAIGGIFVLLLLLLQKNLSQNQRNQNMTRPLKLPDRVYQLESQIRLMQQQIKNLEKDLAVSRNGLNAKALENQIANKVKEELRIALDSKPSTEKVDKGSPVQSSSRSKSYPIKKPANPVLPPLSLTDRYEEYKRNNDEVGFIQQCPCRKVKYENYQSLNISPNAKEVFIEDADGHFLLCKDLQGECWLLPRMSATIKSRYFEMFERIFDITNGDGIGFKVYKAAQVKSIENGRYELIEKGSIRIC